MANMNVKIRLEKISTELAMVRSHVDLYSGVDEKHARVIDNLASEIAVEAARIAAEARAKLGVKERKGALVARVRKALGFTY